MIFRCPASFSGRPAPFLGQVQGFPLFPRYALRFLPDNMCLCATDSTHGMRVCPQPGQPHKSKLDSIFDATI